MENHGQRMSKESPRAAWLSRGYRQESLEEFVVVIGVGGLGACHG